MSQIHVVGSFVESQTATVVEIHRELGREALTQHLDRGGHLLLGDLFVLLLLVGGLEALPGQRAAVEVHHHVAEGLHVVPAALLDAEVGVDRGVPGRPGQVLVLPVHDVDAGPEVAVLFRQSEVNHEEFVAVPPDAHQEVVRLDVPVDEVLHVEVFEAADHLVHEHEHRFDGKMATAEVEQILEGRPEEIHDEDIVVPLLAKVSNVRDSDAPDQHFVEFVLVHQLRVPGRQAFHLEGHLLAICNVYSKVDVSERTGADLSYDPVLAGHDKLIHGDGCNFRSFLCYFVMTNGVTLFHGLLEGDLKRGSPQAQKTTTKRNPRKTLLFFFFFVSSTLCSSSEQRAHTTHKPERFSSFCFLLLRALILLLLPLLTVPYYGSQQSGTRAGRENLKRKKNEKTNEKKKPSQRRGLLRSSSSCTHLLLAGCC